MNTPRSVPWVRGRYKNNYRHSSFASLIQDRAMLLNLCKFRDRDTFLTG